jgi:hypothetical protein
VVSTMSNRLVNSSDSGTVDAVATSLCDQETSWTSTSSAIYTCFE